ncbi:hypothetical protein B0F87_107149 [Methylobacter tundripaludum]|uniref:Uncharacterized protein n=1 Tax=Methylobacter tundripaludum TaxID=173365 RepID=A0A2S6HBV4_9GAMM|nr:hypothetical protein [Methylobacter tundripaludum]PPK74906.1 hypothetical protein B0F87_107149 [Methylobacter tundripaludum]
MSVGVFASISSSYLKAAKNVFTYFDYSPSLLKPVVLLLALIYALFLLFIGIIFYCFIILDWVGQLTDGIRNFFMSVIENNSYRVGSSLFSFLFRPLGMLVLAPLFLISLCIPKFSSAVELDPYGVSDAMGTFKRIQQAFWQAAKRLFYYVSNSFILLMPFVAVIAVFYSLVLIVMGLVFFLLIPLDWISHLVENIREGIANFCHNHQRKIVYSFADFLFSPILLIILSPIFMGLLIIPKFSGELASNSIS